MRKLIPLPEAGAALEKCSSGRQAACAVYRSRPREAEERAACPYLRESLVQYCGASPITKFVPYSESLLSRCGNGGYRYCELYLGLAHPGMEHVEGIPLPEWLRYSRNHMWLDVTEDGMCHAGIDAFLSRALGEVRAITYLCPPGRLQAAAVLSMAGLDLEVVFPNPLRMTSCNLRLRSNPGKLRTEPYTGGWLFEGTPEPETAAGLLEGAAAREWMEQEQGRMNEFLQHLLSADAALAADGGVFAGDLAGHLDREQMLALFHEFFSPYRKRES